MSSSGASQEELRLEIDDNSEREEPSRLGQELDPSIMSDDDVELSFDGVDENDAPDPPMSLRKERGSMRSMMESDSNLQSLPEEPPVKQKKDEKKKQKKIKKPRAADKAKTSDPVVENGYSKSPRSEKEGATEKETRSVDLSLSADPSTVDTNGGKKKSKKDKGKAKTSGASVKDNGHSKPQRSKKKGASEKET